MGLAWLGAGLLVGALASSNATAGEKTAADLTPATKAINAFGLNLLGKMTGNGNVVVSPYSIQIALAMTYAGAAGDTKVEMARVLHFPSDESALHRSFAALQRVLVEVERRTAKMADRNNQRGGTLEPITLRVANRLYGQAGFEIREPFLALLTNNYRAPFAAVDFKGNAQAAVRAINDWVASQTSDRIRDLVSGLPPDTRLVLANAVYLKAQWRHKFPSRETKPRPFHFADGKVADVPTLQSLDDFGYAKQDGFTAVTLPYLGGELQFLVMLPDEGRNLADLEARLTPTVLIALARAKTRDVILELPKLKCDPPPMNLVPALQSLGLKQAFDNPPGSANFDRIVPRRPSGYLAISEVVHKSFLKVDEGGTEAAAATAAGPVAAFIDNRPPPPPPVVVRVDRPFLFAIQHRASGASLFLGRVIDPR